MSETSAIAFPSRPEASLLEMNLLFSESERDKLRQSELAKYDMAYFEGDYWKEDLAGVSGNRGLSYDDPTHKLRFEILASALAHHAAPSSVLDVGCGPGLLCQALAERCERIAGIDASPAAIELANRAVRKLNAGISRISVLEANAISLPFEDEEFDLVTCLDVLEHLPVFDIQAAVQEVLRVCSCLVILSINTDNPYDFHPTILSPATWRAIFVSQAGFVRDSDCERAMSQSVSSKRAEYDFYCYRRLRHRNGQFPE